MKYEQHEIQTQYILNNLIFLKAMQVLINSCDDYVFQHIKYKIQNVSHPQRS